MPSTAVRVPRRRPWWGAVPVALAVALAACQPTVKVEAPDKPIEINLNVKIQQEVRIKVEKDVESLLSSNDDLF
jgi:hypothetical protein